MKQISEAAAQAVLELVERGKLKKDDIFVVGCSSSEIAGGVIGKNSVLETAEAAFEGMYSILSEKGIYLAAQCCEHLNRALIVEKECAEKYNLDIVCVCPKPKAGGSFATTAFARFKNPVAVEQIKAHAGIDIGSTLIGMHLCHVAVPARLTVTHIGKASITCAYTRPKYIGGIRAEYE